MRVGLSATPKSARASPATRIPAGISQGRGWASLANPKSGCTTDEARLNASRTVPLAASV
jgi:hypothetical protein